MQRVHFSFMPSRSRPAREKIPSSPPRGQTNRQKNRARDPAKASTEKKGERWDQEGDRIQQSRRLDPEERRPGKKQQRRELPPRPPGLCSPLLCIFPVVEAHRMIQRPEGTDPPAEGPAEQQGHGYKQQGQKEGGGKLGRGEERRQEDEEVGVEEDLDGIGEFVPSVAVRLDAREQKTGG